jgi:hypothetical protein
MQIHPEFDVNTKTWFWQDQEARTIPELCCKVGEGTTVKNYYPKGYLTSKLVTIKIKQHCLQVLEAARTLHIVTLGKPQLPVVKAPPKPRKPRKAVVRTAPDQVWSSDEVGTLLTGLERNMSSKQIANMLGRTRNSVIGKVKRMGLCFNGSLAIDMDFRHVLHRDTSIS